jgi:glycerophosphoryl diester phosphodiesterase
LNGLIILKPPAFWWGAVFAGAIAAVYVLLALLLLVRRVYAIPILTFERDVRPRAALRSSIDLSRGAWLRIGGALAAWAITSSLLTAGSLALLHGALLRLISWSGFSTASAVIATGTALVVHAAAVTVLSMLANVTFAAVLLSLYRQVAPSAALSNEEQQAPPGRGRIGWLAALGLLVLVAVGAGVGYLTLRELKLNEPLEITAHRAGAAHGPENTVAALRRAIADRADWAEIDVQLTADNEIVVMHDIDLARVGGGNRRVGEATLKDVQAFDVGASFGPAFAGERIPTFRAMLAAAQGKIRLNVELKPHGKADAPELTRRVVAEIRSAGMVPHCRLCSQSYESLQLARQIEPPLEVGFIAATSVGDLAELNVNFLMVKSNLITRALVDRARLRNIAVHAWTVNDPAQVAPLLDAGIANAITDDPARIRSQLDELRGLSSIERLLLRTRSALVQH